MDIIQKIKFLLLFFIIKTNCGVYNHLDIQLVLIILSTGDHNGNIVKDEKTNDYF